MATPRIVKTVLRTTAAQWVLAGPIALYFILIRLTCRIDRPPPPIEPPFIIAMWHGRLVLLPLFRHSDKPMIALISGHRDGQIISKVAWLFNILTATGSSSKGGSRAVRELIRWARQGHSLYVTPDGPRGPRMRADPGVVDLARLTGLPIVPATMSAHRALQMQSWDRFIVPWFFTRVVVRWGEPIRVTAGDDREVMRARLEAAMIAVQNEGDRVAGRPPVEPG